MISPHPRDRCAFCGSGSRVRGDLIPTKLAATFANAVRCSDVVTCVRRQHRRVLRHRGLAA